MRPLKILIVEDELVTAHNLSEQLAGMGYLVTGIASGSEDALLAFRKNLPDLTLLDIQLKGSRMDGIELAGALNDIQRMPLIFLTAFTDERTKARAKAVHPANYLVKPCHELQLRTAIEFALANFVQLKEASWDDALSGMKAPGCPFYSTGQFFFAKVKERWVRVELADIVWVEAAGSSAYIHTLNNKIVVSANLHSFLEQVKYPALVQAHRSFAVNIHRVAAFDKGRVWLPFNGEQKVIEVGPTYREPFFSHFQKLKAD